MKMFYLYIFIPRIRFAIDVILMQLLFIAS